jgi:hypothetical protein
VSIVYIHRRGNQDSERLRGLVRVTQLSYNLLKSVWVIHEDFFWLDVITIRCPGARGEGLGVSQLPDVCATGSHRKAF